MKEMMMENDMAWPRLFCSPLCVSLKTPALSVVLSLDNWWWRPFKKEALFCNESNFVAIATTTAMQCRLCMSWWTTTNAMNAVDYMKVSLYWTFEGKTRFLPTTTTDFFPFLWTLLYVSTLFKVTRNWIFEIDIFTLQNILCLQCKAWTLSSYCADISVRSSYILHALLIPGWIFRRFDVSSRRRQRRGREG